MINDNLKPIISKCGIKTAINYDIKEQFSDLLAKNKNVKINMNKIGLIDFDCIRETYVTNFMIII